MSLMMHTPIRTGVKLRQICEVYGMVAAYDRKLSAWALTRNPHHSGGEKFTTEYVLPEQLATITGNQLLTLYRPRVDLHGNL